MPTSAAPQEPAAIGRRRAATLHRVDLVLDSAMRALRWAHDSADLGVKHLAASQCRDHLDAALAILSRQEPEAVLAAHAAAPTAADPGTAFAVPAGFDCAITAHPLGGYALFWPDRTISGRYPTSTDARREAALNHYRAYEERPQA